MDEIRWKLCHPAENSEVEEWIMARRRSTERAFAWTNWRVRWFPRFKRWRVQYMEVSATTRTGQEYLRAVTKAEFPCDPSVKDFVGEQARAFAESAWRIQGG